MTNPHETAALDHLTAAEEARAALAKLYRSGEAPASLVADHHATIRNSQAAAKILATLAIAWELAHKGIQSHQVDGPPIGPTEASPTPELARRLVEGAARDFPGGKVRRGR